MCPGTNAASPRIISAGGAKFRPDFASPARRHLRTIQWIGGLAGPQGESPMQRIYFVADREDQFRRVETEAVEAL
ncbi:MAG TPA: hypothetical protein VF170_05690, partial [Planctomycetaceae bacterium]